MPKLKTVKFDKDRIKLSARGKLRSLRPGRRHLLGHKRAKTKRQLHRTRIVPQGEAVALRSLLPYR